MLPGSAGCYCSLNEFNHGRVFDGQARFFFFSLYTISHFSILSIKRRDEQHIHSVIKRKKAEEAEEAEEEEHSKKVVLKRCGTETQEIYQRRNNVTS